MFIIPPARSFVKTQGFPCKPAGAVVQYFRRRYINRRSAASLNSSRGEVVLMGDGRGAKALRFVVWFIVVLFLMILTAQKAY